MNEDISQLKDRIKHLEKTFSEEIKRKDKIIEELREHNAAIFKAAMKSSEKIEDLTIKLNKVTKSQAQKNIKKDE